MTVDPTHPAQPAPVVQQFYGAPVRPTSGTATASMIFGIAGILLFCLVVPSLVAVVLGHSAIRDTRTGRLAGHGQAVTGLILGWVVVGPAIVWGVWAVLGFIAAALGA